MSSDIETASTLKRCRFAEVNDSIDLPDDWLGYKQTQKLKLNDLNEDCLIQIMRDFSLSDVNAVAATCHHFDDFVANNLYRYHSSLAHFDIETMGQRYRTRDIDYKVDCIKRYLERFGKFIKH